MRSSNMETMDFPVPSAFAPRQPSYMERCRSATDSAKVDHKQYCIPVDRECASDPFVGTGGLFEDLERDYSVPWSDATWNGEILAEDNPAADWLETFGLIPEFDSSVLMDAVDDAANCVDWSSWDSYLNSSHLECGLKENLKEEIKSMSLCGMSSTSINAEVSAIHVSPVGSKPTPIITRAPPRLVFVPKEPQEELIPIPSPERPRRYVSRTKPKRRARDVSPEERRRVLNRDAAYRYRERKKAEKEALFDEKESLEKKNRVLRAKERLLRDQITQLRKRMC